MFVTLLGIMSLLFSYVKRISSLYFGGFCIILTVIALSYFSNLQYLNDFYIPYLLSYAF